MTRPDPTALAEQARATAEILRATYNTGEVRVHRAADLLNTLAAHILTLEEERRKQPAPSESRPFKVGDRVRIARRVEIDSAGNDCAWQAVPMDASIGCLGTIRIMGGDAIACCVEVDWTAARWWYSPEALDLLPAEDAQ